MDELAFIPPRLLEQCVTIVQSYQVRNKDQSLPDMLWKARLGGLIETQTRLSRITREAAHSRSARLANDGFVQVAALILALEVLASDYVKWGTVYSEAQRLAETLLRRAPGGRPWLIYQYIYSSSNASLGQPMPDMISQEPASEASARPGCFMSECSGAARRSGSVEEGAGVE